MVSISSLPTSPALAPTRSACAPRFAPLTIGAIDGVCAVATVGCAAAIDDNDDDDDDDDDDDADRRCAERVRAQSELWRLTSG